MGGSIASFPLSTCQSHAWPHTARTFRTYSELRGGPAFVICKLSPTHDEQPIILHFSGATVHRSRLAGGAAPGWPEDPRCCHWCVGRHITFCPGNLLAVRPPSCRRISIS